MEPPRGSFPIPPFSFLELLLLVSFFLVGGGDTPFESFGCDQFLPVSYYKEALFHGYYATDTKEDSTSTFFPLLLLKTTLQT